MTRVRRFLSDLALIPGIYRDLVGQARAQRDMEEALRNYQAARAADPEGVAELLRLRDEPLHARDDLALARRQARCREIMSRWERGPVRVGGGLR